MDRCLSGRWGCQAGAESEVERGQQAARDSRNDGTSGRALGRSFKAGRKEGQPDPKSREDALQTLTRTSGMLRAGARLRWDHK